MRKKVCLGLVLSLCLALFACSLQPTEVSGEPSGDLTAAMPPTPNMSPDLDSSARPDPTPLPSSDTIEPPPTPKLMTYEEYFSKERKFYWDANENDEPYMFYDSVFEVKSDVPFEEPYYVVRRLDGEVVIPEYTDYCEVFGARAIYCVDNEKIYLYDDTSGLHTELYRSQKGTVKELQSDGYALFFSDGTEVYRIFLQDLTLDFIVDIGWDSSKNVDAVEYHSIYSDMGTNGYFTVRTNNVISFSMLLTDWYKDDAVEAGMELSEYVYKKMDQHYISFDTVMYDASLCVYAGYERDFEVLGIPESQRMTYTEFKEIFSYPTTVNW